MSKDAVYVTFKSKDDENKTEVKVIPFSQQVLRGIKEKIKGQYEKLKLKQPIEFNQNYKADEEEILYIPDYEDVDDSIKNVLSAVNGHDVGIVSSVASLKDSLGLFFCFSELDAKIVFQRFTRGLVLDKSKSLFKRLSKRVFDYVNQDTFTVGSTIHGYYSDPKNLYFSSTQVVSKIFPAFSLRYMQSATKEQIKSFFSNVVFDQDSTKDVINSNSQVLARLVWRIQNDKSVNLQDQISNLEKISNGLNMCCVTEDGKIRMFKDLRKTKLVFQIILGDVYQQGEKYFLVNSKRPLTPFKD